MKVLTSPALLEAQPLVVTTGPYAGRICENDDDAFLYRSELGEFERDWCDEEGLDWGLHRYQEFEGGPWELTEEIGAFFEYVSFGFYLYCGTTYVIPRDFLKPATMHDLVTRSQVLGDELMRHALVKSESYFVEDRVELLLEHQYILSTIWSFENMAKHPASVQKKIFLCHSSADKPFVRQVRNDLANAGHKAWIDEFEIGVGDSIVDKISSATFEADALVIFISESSIDSKWVQREWQSSLMRKLSGGDVKILPAMIQSVQLPAILSDIKYADFTESYDDGLGGLLRALAHS